MCGTEALTLADYEKKDQQIKTLRQQERMTWTDWSSDSSSGSSGSDKSNSCGSSYEFSDGL